MTITDLKNTFLQCGLSPEQQVDALLDVLAEQNLINVAHASILSNNTPIDMTGKILVEIQRRVHTISDEYSTYAIPEGAYRQRLSLAGFNEYTAFRDIKDSSYNNECVRLSFSAEQDEVIKVHNVDIQEI